MRLLDTVEYSEICKYDSLANKHKLFTIATESVMRQIGIEISKLSTDLK